jgi:hypothetical protein
MQEVLVFGIVAIAVVFLGRRLWQFFRGNRNTSCGCGCSGCPTDSGTSPPHTPFPMHKN